MGFLTKSANKEDGDNPGKDIEEQYEKLFPKMGRDFLHKKDFENMLGRILSIIDPLGLAPIDFSDDSEARKRALEYKSFLDDSKDGSKVYKDLIKLDDDDEDEEEEE